MLRQRQWDDVFAVGDQRARQHRLTEKDIAPELLNELRDVLSHRTFRLTATRATAITELAAHTFTLVDLLGLAQ